MLQDDLWKTSLERGGGLFCANVYSKRGPFAPCNNCCWCGSYYEPSALFYFPRQTPVDDNGIDQRLLVGHELRFLEGRNGDDNLIIPFSGICVIFEIFWEEDPFWSRFEDSEIMALIRRASLDSLWAREPNTVRANRWEAVQMERFASRLRLPSTTLAI